MLHRGEERSNQIRGESARVEPRSFRTYTPSLAVIAKSAGCYHWTPEGRMLADFTSGVLVANLGHNPARWWRRVLDDLGLREHFSAWENAKTEGAQTEDAKSTEQGRGGSAESSIARSEAVHRGDFDAFLPAAPLSAYNALTELEIRAAERLLSTMRGQGGGARMEQVAWAASGSEAIQKALWAARAFRKDRPVILATRHGFHGKKGLAGAVTGSEDSPDRHPDVRFISFPQKECVNTRRRREPLDLAPYQRELETLWRELGGRIGCLITEPYLGAAGSFHPQPEYLQLLERFCRQHDIVFILDEIQANFGRTGEMFAFTTYGIEPDIVCLGKGLGNGVAVAAACGRAEIFAPQGFGETSDTYSGNPLACAAVLATLEEFTERDITEHDVTEHDITEHDVIGHGKKLADVLERGLVRLEELPAVANVRGEGGVWGVECAAIGETSSADVANACVRGCYVGDSSGRAVHLLGPLAGNVIRVSPPLVMPLDEAEEYLGVMHNVIAAVPGNLNEK